MVEDELGFLRDLTEAPGVPGFEDRVRQVMRRHLSRYGEVETDHLGSIVARMPGTAEDPRVILIGHMDEVGFLVTQITEDGFLRFQTLGGWWEQVMLAQRVTVHAKERDLVGVIGSKPPHVLTPDEAKKVVDKKEMFIDIGVGSREAARAAGVRPGDPVTPMCPFTPLADPKYLLAKAWDNRLGCALAVGVAAELAGGKHPNTLFAGGSVQEEVGLRGAGTITHKVKPDIGIAIDVTIAGDTPGMKPTEATAKLGQGPVLLLYDGSMVPHRGLRDLVIDTAERENIPLQLDALARGGTDAGRIHQAYSGVPSVVIGAATRYIHSSVSILHHDDLSGAVRLVAAVVRRLDRATVAELTAND